MWNCSCVFLILCSNSVHFCFCQKYPNKELHPDGRDSVWDAKTGFILPSYLISYAGVVSCQTHIGNETFKSPLYIVAVVGRKEKRSCVQVNAVEVFHWSEWTQQCHGKTASQCWILLNCVCVCERQWQSVSKYDKLSEPRREGVERERERERERESERERDCRLGRTMASRLTAVSSLPFPQDTRSMTSPWPRRKWSCLRGSGWCSAAWPTPSSTWASSSTGLTLVRPWSVPEALLLSWFKVPV